MSRSAISIPPWINPLYNLIDEHLRDIELAKQLMGDDGITKIYEMYFSAYSRDEFDDALERRMSNIKEFTEISRWNIMPSRTTMIRHINQTRSTSRLRRMPCQDICRSISAGIIRVTRLREVRVLLGFTRVDAPDPDADEQRMLWH